MAQFFPWLGKAFRPVVEWRFARSAGALMGLSLLAGCWLSEAPLLGAHNASSVDFHGPYKPDKEDVVVEVTANSDGSYALTDNNGEGFTAYFLAVQDGWYVAQQDFKKLVSQTEAGQVEGGGLEMKAAEGEGPYLYNLMRLDGKDLQFYTPDCDEGVMAIDGVTGESGKQEIMQTCIFENISALKSAALWFIGQLESGEIKEEPSVLRAMAGTAE